MKKLQRCMDWFCGAGNYQKKSGMNQQDWQQATAFTSMDFGWIILCVGMSLGAGIIFLPIQVGLSGLLVFLIAALIGYPIAYAHQKLYLNVLIEAPICEDFAGIISGYLGKNWGFFLGILYFIFTTILIFLYSTALTNDSASFLMTFGVTTSNMSENIWYGLGLITAIVLIASQGEKALMKVSSGMVFVKVIVIALLGLVMIPLWQVTHMFIPSEAAYMIKHVIILLPFIAMSIEFFVALGPIAIYYRSHHENKVVAHYRSLRIYHLAYVFLVVLVLFYTISFNLAMQHDQILQAYAENISALALAAKDLDDTWFKLLNLLLNIFAVVTAYFAMFLGFRDACMGIFRNVLKRYMSEQHINQQLLLYGSSVFCVLLCWGISILNIPILRVTPFLGALIGIIACFLPVYVVLMLPDFKKYKGKVLYPIVGMGILLMISPLLAWL